MTKVTTSILFLMWTSTACRTDSSKNQLDSIRTELNNDTRKTAVISWDKNSNYPFDSSNYNPSTLTQADIEQIERSLIEAVTDYNNSLSQGHEEFKIDLNAKDYKKQLVVVSNSNGEKEVWINCFCDASDKSWQTQIVSVDDGGPCYFNFKLNLTTKKVYDLIVNGFA